MIQLSGFDANCFVANVFSDKNNHKLDWMSSPGTGAMIIRCPYKIYPFDQLDYLIEQVNSMNLMNGQFNEMTGRNGERFAIRMVDPTEKAREGGCRNVSSAFSYVVLACKFLGPDRIVYMPNTVPDVEYGRKQQTADVPMVISMTYSREIYTQKRLFGRNTETETGFYIVDTDNISQALTGMDYHDGDIYYSIDGFQIPITRPMLERKIFIEAEEFPQFGSDNGAIEITCKEVYEG